jgi:hypothetical protein
MAQDVMVDKSKFDTLLQKMLATPPLPKSEVKVVKPKPKKKKSVTTYVIMDGGEYLGYIAEMASLYDAANNIRSPKEYVVALENGKRRELTASEKVDLELLCIRLPSDFRIH